MGVVTQWACTFPLDSRGTSSADEVKKLKAFAVKLKKELGEAKERVSVCVCVCVCVCECPSLLYRKRCYGNRVRMQSHWRVRD